MKKIIIALTIALLTISMTACSRDNDNDTNDDNIAEDLGDAARDTVDDIDRAGDRITDGTAFDTDNNYNVDEYTANGTETK